MTPPPIRPARLYEREVLEALQRRASLSNAGDRAALLDSPDAITLPLEQIASDQVFVAERNGAIVGFAVVLPRTDGDGELDGLFVEPDIWRQGIGRALVDRCGEVAYARGAAALHVVGNPHARDFYVACGFEITGTQSTRFGFGLLMQKKL
jgi:GNAT superfamily N-acetyltransferase